MNNVTTPSSEVLHYNILYKLDNKDNKENILANEPCSFTDKDNIFSSIPSDLSPKGENIPASPCSQPGLPQVESFVSGVGNSEIDQRDLCDDQIKRSIIQFFDNGENVAQRYKVKIRLNLIDGDNPEFIAVLTKDWSNFTKYIPEECKNEIKEFAQGMRSQIKKQFNTTPYLGKFHLNQGRRPDSNRAFTQIEPWTVIAVWYDNENCIWKYHLQIQDWIHAGNFLSTYLTEAQKKIGVKGQDVYINPKYEVRQRPKTWAELRAEKRAAK